MTKSSRNCKNENPRKRPRFPPTDEMRLFDVNMRASSITSIFVEIRLKVTENESDVLESENCQGTWVVDTVYFSSVHGVFLN